MENVEREVEATRLIVEEAQHAKEYAERLIFLQQERDFQRDKDLAKLKAMLHMTFAGSGSSSFILSSADKEELVDYENSPEDCLSLPNVNKIVLKSQENRDIHEVNIFGSKIYINLTI